MVKTTFVLDDVCKTEHSQNTGFMQLGQTLCGETEPRECRVKLIFGDTEPNLFPLRKSRKKI